MTESALVFICTYDGTITQVIRDTDGWLTERHLRLSDLLDSESVAKARQFLARTVADQTTLGWELRLLSDERSDTWQFSGITTPCGMYIMAQPASDSAMLLGMISEINNELVNTQRTMAKQNNQLQALYRENLGTTMFLESLRLATQAVTGEIEVEPILATIDEYTRMLFPQISEVAIYPSCSDAPPGILPQVICASLQDDALTVETPPGLLLPLQISPGERGVLHLTGVLAEEDKRRLGLFLAYANTALSHASLVRHIRDEAITDPLTKIYNRRGWENLGQRETARVNRFGHPMSLIMFDIDHFKDVNDTYGHTVGDKVLLHLVQTVQTSLRDIDILGRYGGEEFIVVLPETDQRAAVLVAERLRSIVAASPIIVEPQAITITISLGVATLSSHESTTFEDLIEKADAALYQAKHAGRNRVETAE